MLKSNPGGEKVVILGSTWVNITGKANGKEFLTGYDEEELEICLGRGSIAKGLELALADMRIGERCRVECHEGYGYGDRYVCAFKNYGNTTPYIQSCLPLHNIVSSVYNS